MIDRSFIRTSRGQLHCRRTGSGDPLILLQTCPFDNQIFEGLMGIMAPRYDCLAIDMMGYGHSDRRTGTWLVADYADNLAEALDGLDLDPVRIVSGHFTATIATDFAIARPDRVRALVLDGIAARSPEQQLAIRDAETPRIPLDTAGEQMLYNWQTVFGVMRKLNPELVLTPDNEALVAHAFFAHMEILLGPEARLATIIHDLSARLPLLTVPTLLIGSPTDTMRGNHARAASLIPGGQTYIFEGINPLYQFDRPERAGLYAEVIERFFKEDRVS